MLSLPLPISRCFPLFTPIGEMNWVPGWRPRFLWPSDGHTCEGMVFLTGTGEEETLWTMVDYDERNHYARYCRITPGSRSTLVEIRCTEAGPEQTDVEVRYTLTAHNEAGNEAVRGFVAAFPAMMEDWRRLILNYAGAKGPSH